jgi:Flp pilus assembly protein TadG
MIRCPQISTIFRRLTARTRQERGQAMVEFAVILPVLMLIVYGILWFGRYEDYTNQETQMAEEGARLAAVNSDPGSPTTLQNYIQAQAQPELQAGSTDVTTAAKVYIYYPTGSSNAVGSSVRVCVTATFKYPFLSTSENVTELATMRVEQADTTAFTADTTLPSGCTKT